MDNNRNVFPTVYSAFYSFYNELRFRCIGESNFILIILSEFFNLNIELNGLPHIPFRRADWTDADLGRFDLIIGADLLYEPDHPAQLASFLERHAAPGAEIVIADPGRRQLSRFRKLMAGRNYQCSETRFPPRGRLLTFA